MTSARGYAPLAPPPTDPATCRWCKRILVISDDGTASCASGCAANDNPLYLGFCQTCHREFETGAKWDVDQCWECSEREMAALTADLGQSPKSTGYTVDRTRRGASREAVKLLRRAQPQANREPPDADGETFRGGEAQAEQRHEMAEIQRSLK